MVRPRARASEAASPRVRARPRRRPSCSLRDRPGAMSGPAAVALREVAGGAARVPPLAEPPHVEEGQQRVEPVEGRAPDEDSDRHAGRESRGLLVEMENAPRVFPEPPPGEQHDGEISAAVPHEPPGRSGGASAIVTATATSLPRR